MEPLAFCSGTAVDIDGAQGTGTCERLVELSGSGKAAQAYAICVTLAASPEGQALLRSLHQAVTQVMVQYGSQVPQEYFAALQTVQEMTGKFLH